ncbi:guanine nucleotide-binding protein G(I)/G(S)/G(O) subunit gamma-10 [Cebus imitator]|uniref:guanine nucleotide-binding protein G(I)/G(S)/G(O) subunit gamma-10 n=1 Tax=Cebus imitator TaxID=2715852 RepID=UPI00080A01B1|nr:guanine nucleotide-binding protein G(I)/G(S)/G(O) subunit gamma-10 [Cebus imitator]XP_037585479.1 guanine nucleotide-binding protein G(I)/G(S)/G(O) subunit gamma-10 [Cebus imitator]
MPPRFRALRSREQGLCSGPAVSGLRLRAGCAGATGRAQRLPRPGAVPSLEAGGSSPPGRAQQPSELSAAAMSSGASANALQRLVEQLKLEAAVERIKVSQAAAELQQYCMQNACKDALLVGVPAGSNPFREPRSCALL